MKTAEQLHRITLRRGLRPIPKISVDEWADRYAIVPAGSAEPGRWKTSRVPYMREVMRAFTEPGVERIVVKSAAQVAKTSVLLNVIGRFAHVDPAPMMIIQPTLEMATDFSKSRLQRFIDDVKPLTKIFYGERASAATRDPNQTLLSKFFQGGRVVLAGANSPAGLASRPIRILLCDEVDRYPASAGDEGDPIGLAARRTSTYFNRKIGLFSTPTTEGESRIDLEYLTGTQEEWRHRCPNCGEYQLLQHIDMEVESAASKDAAGNERAVVKAVRWRCPDCGVDYDEMAIKQTSQKYVAQNPTALENGIRSFSITGFASPWTSWRAIMQEWTEARGKPELEKVVMNTRFGQSYRLTDAFDEAAPYILMRRREEYGAELPDGVMVLTAAVDVQENRLEYEVCGWSRAEESWGIVKSEIGISPNNPEAWRQLDAVLDKEYRFKNGDTLKVALTFIDSGFLTTTVYEYCRRNRLKARLAVKGYGAALGIKLLHKVTLEKASMVPVIILGVNEGKQSVFSRLTIEESGAQYMHYGLDDDHIENRGYDLRYFKGLVSERKVMKWSGGVAYSVWKPAHSHARNEPLDLRVYNLAAFQFLKPRIDWAALEAAARGIVLPAKASVRRGSAPTARSKTKDIWTE